MQFAMLARDVAFVAGLASVATSSEIRSPLSVERVDRALGAVEVVLDAARLAQLDGAARATLRDIELPDGVRVDLELERVDLARYRPVFYVDGVAAPHLLDSIELSLWAGRVHGAADSEAMLSFSNVGCRGWIRHAGELFHLIPEEGTPRARWISESSLARVGVKPSFACGADEPVAPVPVNSPELGESGFPGAQQVTTSLLECKIAVETDWQLNQVFAGNLAAESSYVATLITWIAYRYEEQVQFVLTYPYVNFYTTPNDPWTTPDIPGTAIQMQNEFHTVWLHNVPNGARFGTFLSGALLGGGAGATNAVCSVNQGGESATGNMHGQTPFPILQGPLTWDFVAVAHELGHNFGSLHTHSYCPPIDECPPQQYWGQCQTQQACISNGSIMSYCHLCAGGMNNITTYFEPFTAGAMRYLTEIYWGCLPLYAPDPSAYCTAKPNSLGCTPQIAYAGHPTLSGLDDFHVRCTQALNNKNGLLMWSALSASQPFHGGTKCIASPLSKSAMLSSAGNASGNDCSGVYDVGFSHAFLTSHGLTGGTTFYAQFWMRDPASSGTIGLSNGLQIPVSN